MKRILFFILGFLVALLLVLFLPAWVALHLLLEGWLGVDENAPDFIANNTSPTAGRAGRGLQGAFSARTQRVKKRA